MKRSYRKKSYPLDEIRRFLEPGPIVLVSSAWQGSSNIMTMGWHMCRLRDTRMIRTYSLFIWEVVKAHVAMSPKRPQTIHYRGEGEFMISGRTINRRRKFRPENL